MGYDYMLIEEEIKKVKEKIRTLEDINNEINR